MKMRRRVWLFLAAGLLGALASCDRQQPVGTLVEDVRNVVFLSARGDRPFETGQRLVLARLMAGTPHLSLQTQEAGLNPGTQATQFKVALAEKPFAIIVDPLDPKALEADIKEAVAAGILVVGLGEVAKDMGCSTVVLADQRHLGQLAGELVVRSLLIKAQSESQSEATGRVIEIRGDDESAVCQRRHEGFEAALKLAPGVILVHDAPGGWSKKGGADRTLDALRLQQSFDVVYAHNDVMAMGAAEALKDRRADVMIIGTDGFRGQEGGMTLVGDGEIDATLYQPLLVDFARQILLKKSKEPSFTPKAQYELSSRAITLKDVDDIRRNGLPAYPEL